MSMVMSKMEEKYSMTIWMRHPLSKKRRKEEAKKEVELIKVLMKMLRLQTEIYKKCLLICQ